MECESLSDLLKKSVTNPDARFLWATLQLDHLCKKSSDSAIKAALHKVPDDLTSTYAQILLELDRMDSDQKTLAIACFRWMLCAMRTLRWVELEVPLALAGSSPPRSYDDCLDCPLPAHVMSACGNLVHIPEHQDNRWWAGERVTLIHSSLFQFLSQNLSSLGLNEGAWTILSDVRAMHRRAAFDCLNYLYVMIDSLDPNRPIEQQVDYRAFAYYVIHYFDEHIIASEEALNPSSELMALVRRILGRKEQFLRSFLLLRLMLQPDVVDGMNPLDSYSLDIDQGPILPDHIIWNTQLYKVPRQFATVSSPGETLLMLAKRGFVEAMHNLIQDSVARNERLDIDEKDEYGFSALYYACERGDDLVVELLLSKGACPQSAVVQHPDAPFERIDWKTPLWVAIFERHASVVGLLLEFGAEVNIPFDYDDDYYYYRYPLSIAAEDDEGTITQLVLDSGADLTLIRIKEADAVGGAEAE